jgi:hypothetical protein
VDLRRETASEHLRRIAPAQRVDVEQLLRVLKSKCTDLEALKGNPSTRSSRRQRCTQSTPSNSSSKQYVLRTAARPYLPARCHRRRTRWCRYQPSRRTPSPRISRRGRRNAPRGALTPRCPVVAKEEDMAPAYGRALVACSAGVVTTKSAQAARRRAGWRDFSWAACPRSQRWR